MDSDRPENNLYLELLAMPSLRNKSIEFVARAEKSGDRDSGTYFASIAQVYATLELARVTALNRPLKK